MDAYWYGGGTYTDTTATECYSCIVEEIVQVRIDKLVGYLVYILALVC
jgi:hypothetical protein